MIRCEGGRCRIEGVVTVDTVGGLLRALQPHLVAGVDVLDFSAVERADSAALALVFSAMRQNHGKLSCTGLPASFATLADLYGVADLLPA
ncbi:MAG: NTP-binding protein [Thiobacillus sp. 65-29]|nr:MAG: NTP-binding protein [Thiobacillus sp. 65-29]